MNAIHVDARGLRCPWPALRLARAMEEGTTITMVADDPAAPGEIAAIAAARGWSLVRQGAEFLLAPPAA